MHILTLHNLEVHMPVFWHGIPCMSYCIFKLLCRACPLWKIISRVYLFIYVLIVCLLFYHWQELTLFSASLWISFWLFPPSWNLKKVRVKFHLYVFSLIIFGLFGQKQSCSFWLCDCAAFYIDWGLWSLEKDFLFIYLFILHGRPQDDFQVLTACTELPVSKVTQFCMLRGDIMGLKPSSSACVLP